MPSASALPFAGPRSPYNALVRLLLAVVLSLAWLPAAALAAAAPDPSAPAFPRPLESYADNAEHGLWAQLVHRAQVDPFNVIATVIFLLAITHTFLASRFMHLSHVWRDEHAKKLQERGLLDVPVEGYKPPVSFKAEMAHFLGEVEAVFGIWCVPLLLAATFFKGWPAVQNYVSHGVHFTEPLFVVVIMCISATRPVLRFAEFCLEKVAGLGGGTRAAWWLSILTVGPILGSFITEPAAMTICALLLARQFYDYRPSDKFMYATIGLLFVNISIGGVLTHFAAPPVLMVAGKWGWGMADMLRDFGWKAVLAILISNGLYFAYFRKEFAKLSLQANAEELPAQWSDRTDRVPVWITVVHLVALAWTVFTAHQPALFIGGFLIFLAFTAATEHHQNPISLKPAILVGFFLGGLVVHGGLQGWWISPVLSSLHEVPLLLIAAVLTAFNDNAAITYLATLVPNFSDIMKHAVVAGAVTGGGLTVIANAPNPAGQSILACYFEDGVSPLKLFLGALVPTVIVAACFLVFLS